MRKQFIAKKAAARKRPTGPKPADELLQQNLPDAIAALHRTLGNRGVARLFSANDKGSTPQVAPVPLSIQREVDDEQARMKEAFKRGGITEEMIRGDRRDGFINYDEEKGTARWEQITYKTGPAPEPLPEDEPARMKEAFKRGGITEEMIRGDRRDGFINYDPDTGIATWEKVTYKHG